MEQPVIEVSDGVAPAVERAIGDGLDAFNAQAVGYSDRQPLSVVVRDAHTGEVLGGITGRTSLGLAFLDLFYLPEHARGAGLGSQVLDAFETEARRRGCGAAVLYTISFQAPEFYEKKGWVRFGTIACEPQGSSRVFMSKEL
ncbi:GNAT family N-acetyltransferase [Pseudomonas entomophila]|uniref:GNAT family N-acetyltransferase n=1 Tax=Pseudomonas sp. RIT-PI-S TaxID=3035295 RepID=UPI0021D8B673